VVIEPGNKENNMPQRVGSPFQFGQAVLEPIVQPVYDRVVVTTAAPNGNFRFFTVVAGKTEREIFPGITGGGQFSAPRMAVIYGSRIHVDEDIGDATQVTDLKNILYNSFYRFHVGVKDYLVGPTFLFPSGLGIAGFAALDGQAAPTTVASATNGVPAFHSHLSIAKRKIAIPPQQAFFGEMVIAGATTPTPGGVDIEVWNVLDSEFGFEVQ
jgi:hypothetical protein